MDINTDLLSDDDREKLNHLYRRVEDLDDEDRAAYWVAIIIAYLFGIASATLLFVFLT